MNPQYWIQIDREIKQTLYGDPNTRHQGHWVLLRRYRIGEYSKYWDEDAKEAIGGPKWKYYDYPMRTSYRIGASFQAGEISSMHISSTDLPGETEIDYRTYIIQRCYRPRVGDHIFEFDCDLPESPNDFMEMAKVTPAIEKFEIKNMERVRPDGNYIEYYLAAAMIDHGRS